MHARAFISETETTKRENESTFQIPWYPPLQVSLLYKLSSTIEKYEDISIEKKKKIQLVRAITSTQ